MTTADDEIEASRAADRSSHRTSLAPHPRAHRFRGDVLCLLRGGEIHLQRSRLAYVAAVGSPEKAQLVYTHGLEYLFTQIQVAVFGAGFLPFPVIATEIYKFVAPGLYRNERQAFLPI